MHHRTRLNARARQLGLGSTMTVDTFTVPTEVVLSRGSPPGTKTRCIDIIAGAYTVSARSAHLIRLQAAT